MTGALIMLGYTCSVCSTYHPLSAYMRARLNECLRPICRICGSIHSIRYGEVHLIQRGWVLLSLDATTTGLTQVSMWYGPEVVPPQPGEYELQFHGVTTPMRARWNGQGWECFVGLRRFNLDVTTLKAWRGRLLAE